MEATERKEKAERIAETMTIYKCDEGYKVPSERDSSEFYVITKSNGRIRCNCPDFQRHQSEQGFRCKHIQAAVISFRSGRVVIEKSPTAQILEYPFRSDQIKKKQGYEYIESAAVIQRLNDAFGYDGWSFEIVDQKAIEDEVITRGRLTVYGPSGEIVKEQYGTHSYARSKGTNEIVSRGQVMKASSTDALKKCASMVGVGLGLYSRGESYQSFIAA